MKRWEKIKLRKRSKRRKRGEQQGPVTQLHIKPRERSKERYSEIEKEKSPEAKGRII